MKTLRVLFLCTILFMATQNLHALTPQERSWAIQAHDYMEKTKQQALDQDKVIDDQNAENERLDQIAQGQQTQIGTLSGQIEVAHKNEQDAVAQAQSEKKIVDQVNAYW